MTESDFCTQVDEKERQQVVDVVDVQFKEMMEKHKRRTAKWYNDDGRYRSAVIEMLNMKENAMAVPKLSLVMYGEWKTKQKFLRQANRMVSKDRSRLLTTPQLISTLSMSSYATQSWFAGFYGPQEMTAIKGRSRHLSFARPMESSRSSWKSATK